MERGTADSDGASGRETCFGREGGFHKPDAAKGDRIGLPEGHPQLLESGYAIRQESLSAGFVDRRVPGIGQGHAKTPAPRGDGGGQARGPSANYKDVGVVERVQDHHLKRSSSEQKAGPIAASTPHVPGAGRRRSMVSSST